MYTIGVIVVLSWFMHVFGGFTIYGPHRKGFAPRDHILSLIMFMLGIALIYPSL